MSVQVPLSDFKMLNDFGLNVRIDGNLFLLTGKKHALCAFLSPLTNSLEIQSGMSHE